MKYAFIHAQRKTFDIKLMCQMLKVSRSGYYKWRSRTPGAREQANQCLAEQIEQIHAMSRHTYGSPVYMLN
jgi:putative transposase